jgi:DNA-binding response OmpR family regulator
MIKFKGWMLSWVLRLQRMTWRVHIEGQRYMAETALDGEEALNKLFETPFDLIILDIMLPKRDGLRWSATNPVST